MLTMFMSTDFKLGLLVNLGLESLEHKRLVRF